MTPGLPVVVAFHHHPSTSISLGAFLKHRNAFLGISTDSGTHCPISPLSHFHCETSVSSPFRGPYAATRLRAPSPRPVGGRCCPFPDTPDRSTGGSHQPSQRRLRVSPRPLAFVQSIPPSHSFLALRRHSHPECRANGVILRVPRLASLGTPSCPEGYPQEPSWSRLQEAKHPPTRYLSRPSLHSTSAFAHVGAERKCWNGSPPFASPFDAGVLSDLW